MSALLKEFGTALRSEREKASFSVANFAKQTAGISKEDVRLFEAGEKVPDKLTVKKIVHCFPILMRFEHALRHETAADSAIRHQKPRRAPAPAPTRLQAPPRQHHAPHKPKLEIVRQGPPPVLTAPLPLVLPPRKTRAEALTELAAVVKKRLGNHTAEDYDFTLKNDGAHLTLKLTIAEGDDMVDSGCYVAVGPRDADGLGVFCKSMTSGNYSTTAHRIAGMIELLKIADVLHEAVRDKRFA